MKLKYALLIFSFILVGAFSYMVLSKKQDQAPTVTRPITEKYYMKDSFKKPTDDELKEELTPLQYKVTQKEGTESAFKNEYNDNKASGIYVDIVSGEPLFYSKDKYDSGTGWPSFVKTVSPEVVVEKSDYSLLGKRTEVRSVVADSHLGHVFEDGPEDRGGKRYCMNSAAMRFIPKEDMERLGYGEYLKEI